MFRRHFISLFFCACAAGCGGKGQPAARRPPVDHRSNVEEKDIGEPAETTVDAPDPWVGLYVDEDTPIDPKDGVRSFVLLKRDTGPYRLYFGKSLHPMRLSAGELVPIESSGKPGRRNEQAPTVLSEGIHRDAQGALHLGNRRYLPQPFLSDTTTTLLSSASEGRAPGRARIEHGFLFLQTRGRSATVTCRVAVLFPETAVTGIAAAASNGRRAFRIFGAEPRFENTAGLCDKTPMPVEPLTVDADPLGSLVLDGQGNPVGLVLQGYMYEESFFPPGLSNEARREIHRLAYAALGINEGASAE